MAQQGQQQGPSGEMVSNVGDLSGFFRKPEDLSKIPSQQGQYGQQDGGNGTQQVPGGGGGNGQQRQPQGATAKGATNDAETLQNPLDVYEGMFSPKPKVDKEGKPIPEAPGPPQFKLDPKVIKDAASKLDFTAGLPQDLAEALSSGQPLDTQTVMKLLNHSTQAAYAASMEHATTLTDRFVDMRLAHERQGMPAEVNRLLARTQALSNPAIKNNPLLREHYESISEKLVAKFPDQPPEWIAEQTNQYFTDIAKAINPKLGETQQDDTGLRTEADGATVKDGKVFDWAAYLKK